MARATCSWAPPSTISRVQARSSSGNGITPAAVAPSPSSSDRPPLPDVRAITSTGSLPSSRRISSAVVTARASSSKQTATVVTPPPSTACRRSAASRPGRSRSMSIGSMRACLARPGCASRIACTRAWASRSMTVMVVDPSCDSRAAASSRQRPNWPTPTITRCGRSRAGRGIERVVGEQQPGAGRVDVEEVEAHAARRRAQRLVAHQRAESGVAEVHGGAQRAGTRRALDARDGRDHLGVGGVGAAHHDHLGRRGEPGLHELVANARVALDDLAVATPQRRHAGDGRVDLDRHHVAAGRGQPGRDARAAVAQPEHDGVAAAALSAPRVGAPAREGGDALEQRRGCDHAGRASAPPGAASWRCRARG